MADWSVLRGSDRDFLSFYGTSFQQMMGDQSTPETFCTVDNIDQSIAHNNQACVHITA